MVSENGTPQCFDIKTGNELWQVKERPGGSAWGSMVHAAGRLYITMRNGTTLVIAASPSFQILATNDIGNEHTDASIVPSGGELFIRSYKHLWCIGGK